MIGVKKVLLLILAGVMTLALIVPVVAQETTATPDPSNTAAAGPSGTLNCDSSLILLAGLAQRYFGYAPSDITLGNYVYGQYSPLFGKQDMSMPSAEATADRSGEATLEATSDVSTEATAEMHSEATMEATTDTMGEATSEAASKITPEATSDVTIEANTHTDSNATMAPAHVTEATAEATADISTEATASVSSEATLEATPDLSADSTMEASSMVLNPPVIANEDPACTQLRASLEKFFSTKLQSDNWDADFRKGMSTNTAPG